MAPSDAPSGALKTLADRAQNAAELALCLQVEVLCRIDPDDDDSLDRLVTDVLKAYPDAEGEDIADAANAICELMLRAETECGDDTLDVEASLAFLAARGDEHAGQLLALLNERLAD